MNAKVIISFKKSASMNDNASKNIYLTNFKEGML